MYVKWKDSEKALNIFCWEIFKFFHNQQIWGEISLRIWPSQKSNLKTQTKFFLKLQIIEILKSKISFPFKICRKWYSLPLLENKINNSLFFYFSEFAIGPWSSVWIYGSLEGNLRKFLTSRMWVLLLEAFFIFVYLSCKHLNLALIVIFYLN